MKPSHPAPTQSGYATHINTNPPEWHWLVVWDLLLNNLAIGLFMAAATADLFRPDLFQPICAIAYPIALILLLADLLCLVLDLGDPFRFHHMLRVFKPSSPMSLGTWSLTAFSFPLTAVVVLDLLTWISVLPAGSPVARITHNLIVLAAIIPAFLSAAYKGVLFSTNAQPGWRDARFLGAYLINSAVMLGCAQLLALSTLMDAGPATSIAHTALAILIALNLVAFILLYQELAPTLFKAYTPRQVKIACDILFATAFVAPTALLLAGPGRVLTFTALALLFFTSLAIRASIVLLPHHAMNT